MRLNTAQRDRARGALIGTAVGDALGAGYEFGSAPLGEDGPKMIGGGLGNFLPGEWTDDTTMAWCIAEVAARGIDIRSEDGLTAIAQNFRAWYDAGPRDIGVQTRRVLDEAGPSPTGAAMMVTAYDLHARSGRSGGNGSLMRTAPIALQFLDEPRAIVEAARKVSALTHFDPDAGDACVLWSLAIGHAINRAELDIRAGLTWLREERAERWSLLIDEAEASQLDLFTPNGWVVSAFQAAWSSIVHTQSDATSAGDHFALAISAAIAIGDDTDTVAAIAGGLVGALAGASAIPTPWRNAIHGYPGITGEELGRLALEAAGQSVEQPDAGPGDPD